MLTDELGLQPEVARPWRAGITTFAAFLSAGVLPLVPFLVPGLATGPRFWCSAAVTGTVFCVVGLLKAAALGGPRARSVVETLLTGGTAAAVAYYVAHSLRSVYGAG
jgi:VIT1/CCC1 family predicted Fe2+/Mn2+ transporter